MLGLFWQHLFLFLFLLLAIRAIFNAPKNSIDQHTCHQTRFWRNNPQKGWLNEWEKVKEAESKYQKSKYWQAWLHDYVETTILQNNAKYTTDSFKSVVTKHSKYTQQPLNSRRKMAVCNIYFQEGQIITSLLMCDHWTVFADIDRGHRLCLWNCVLEFGLPLKNSEKV